MFAVRFLGGFDAANDSGDVITLRSRKARALILLLASRPNGSSRDYLASMLWPENDEKLAKQNLRQALTDIRAAFGQDSLLTTKDSVKLNRALFEIDIDRFAELEHASGEAGLLAFTELYRGPLGADLRLSEPEFDDWLAAGQRHYSEAAAGGLARLIELLKQQSKSREALSAANRLLVIDPFNERTQRQILALEMELHGRARALTRFEEFRSLLRSELDVEPEAETLFLVSQIRAAGSDFTPAEPVAASPKAQENKSAAAASRAPTATAFTTRLVAISGILVVSALILAGIWIEWGQGEKDRRLLSEILPASVEREPLDETSHSIAVLPFSTTPSSPELREQAEYLVAGIARELGLSPPLTVISHQTTRAYEANQSSVQSVARELDVKYVVTGAVQRENDRELIYPKLLDGKTGIELWSGRFELKQEASNLIADEISIAIGRRIERRVERIKTRRAADEPPEAMALIRQGNSIMNTTLCGRLDPKAGHFFSEALRVNPQSVRARALLGQYLIIEIANVRRANLKESIRHAEKLTLEALELDPEDPGAHFTLGLVRRLQGRNDESLAAFERTLQLEPNNASTFAQIGFAKMLLGRFEETEPLIRKAIRLNPRNPANCIWATIAGMANFYLERDDAALAWFYRAIELGPNIPRNHQFVAAIHGLRGDRKKAAEQVEIMLNMSPPTTLRHIRSFPGNFQDPRYQKQRARFIHGAELAFGFANKLEHRTD